MNNCEDEPTLKPKQALQPMSAPFHIGCSEAEDAGPGKGEQDEEGKVGTSEVLSGVCREQGKKNYREVLTGVSREQGIYSIGKYLLGFVGSRGIYSIRITISQ